jgi:hypothetical protein
MVAIQDGSFTSTPAIRSRVASAAPKAASFGLIFSDNGKQLINITNENPFDDARPRAACVRIACTVALVPGFLAFAVVAAQAAPSDPARLVASIYADGKEGAVWSKWLDGNRRGEWFSHALTALWATCDKRAHSINDELGALDFDVATNSQGLEVKSFTVKTLSRDASHATVVAKLTPDNWVRKSDRENEIRYDLVWQGGRWAIDDIHSVIEPNLWSLRTILAQYLAR